MDNSPSLRPSSSPSATQPHLARDATDMDVVPTHEIQRCMTSIDMQLNEVCVIASEGKLNTDQKMKISSLCRKIGHNTSQLAVMYQALKQQAKEASNTIENLKENRDLTAHLTGLRQTIEETCTSGIVSFAEMAKKRSTNVIRQNKISAVAIYPNSDRKSSDETKNLVQKIISPQEIKLQVRGVRKTINGGVIISTETKQDAEKLKQAVQLSTSGLTADEHKKRKHRIVIVGVPSAMAEHEVFHCIYQQNIAEKSPTMSIESFLNSMKLSHKSGKRDAAYCNYIIEVTAKTRRDLLCKYRLFINWHSCPVRDFTLVTRCYKCHQYGHAAKSCRDVAPTCGHCGESGHSMSECRKKTNTPKCASCSRFKKPNNHKTGDVLCPAKKFAEQKYINSIDFKGA